MDIKDSIKAKEDLEQRLFLFISNEIKIFQDNTGISIEKVNVNFLTHYITCGDDIKLLSDVKIHCKF